MHLPVVATCAQCLQPANVRWVERAAPAVRDSGVGRPGESRDCALTFHAPPYRSVILAEAGCKSRASNRRNLRTEALSEATSAAGVSLL
ncbi:hypothetical protein NDU88_003440 [Pleurodeles waltl]|uniref:Uncharacterized protein n=1 Tax=Pleurodeles waltl TaxID=8319 RepID=A0AAV7RIJ9_PLEWA|nr:hypothetical protein NDU88_003440 [Pleurodeles waltl]